jgi:hypothetical protein|tara:strand:+ start:5102 stop:5611 length:510 start_codon:yes stop_codon:yes gene_type:complete
MTDVSNNVEIDVSNVVVEENETYSLKSVLQKYINKSDGKLPLTMSLKRMIICITNVSSDSLAKIETLLEKIFEDKKLDIMDTPNLMIIVQELYELYSSMEFKNLKPENCTDLLKTIAHVMYINKFQGKFTEDESTLMLKSFYSIIDTAAMLIDLKETIPKKKCKFLWCV